MKKFDKLYVREVTGITTLKKLNFYLLEKVSPSNDFLLFPKKDHQNYILSTYKGFKSRLHNVLVTLLQPHLPIGREE